MSSDLQARVRLESAARSLGFEVAALRPDSTLGEVVPKVAVLDLDQLGAEGAALWVDRLGPGIRTLGFFSHVARDLGEVATGLGIETIRRGRFWKELPERLGPH